MVASKSGADFAAALASDVASQEGRAGGSRCFARTIAQVWTPPWRQMDYRGLMGNVP